MTQIIKQTNISSIKELQEPIFKDVQDSVIVRKTILYKEDSLTNPYAVNRYAMFLDKSSCELLNGVQFDRRHYFLFSNNELYIKHYEDMDIEDYDYTSDDDDDYFSFKINKFEIEGKQGLYWKLEDNWFQIYGDM
jgi:hypothetical protein